jgi:hypothetical protein
MLCTVGAVIAPGALVLDCDCVVFEDEEPI